MSAPVEMPVTIAAPAHGGDNGVITRVVLHDEEYPVSSHSAEDIARFFAEPTTGTSAHYVVDADSVQHCVPEHLVAYHAPPNHGSIGIEHDGYMRFKTADWATPGSQATLKRSAALCAAICVRNNIPLVFLSVADLLAGKSGITFHANVSAAWHESTHTDPGAAFPIDQYMTWVRLAAASFAKPLGDSPLLSLGDTGQKVKDVQHALDLCGNSIPIDGVFGPKTQTILRVFQEHRHLEVTGTTTPETWVELRKVAHPNQ